MKGTLITIGIIILIFIGVLAWNKTAYRDIELLKAKAPEFIEERGFKITSYNGFQGGMVHGGYVWYQVRDSSNYLYRMAIGEWRGEIMIYGETCLNAVQNSE